MSEKPEKPAPVEPKKPHQPFIDALSLMNRDGFVDELNDAIETVTAKVMTTGLKGKLTVTLEISHHGEGQARLAGKVTKVMPSRAPLPSIVWAAKDGSLSEDNPDQLQFEGITRIAEHQNNSVTRVR